MAYFVFDEYLEIDSSFSGYFRQMFVLGPLVNLDIVGVEQVLQFHPVSDIKLTDSQ